MKSEEIVRKLVCGHILEAENDELLDLFPNFFIHISAQLWEIECWDL